MDDLFITNHYRILRLMYNNRREHEGVVYCPLGQRELAEELGLSRVCVNKIFKDLINKGYIQLLLRGKWVLLEKTCLLMKKEESE